MMTKFPPHTKFGLIGYPLGHSFSADYFAEIFQRENLTDYQFGMFEIQSLDKLWVLLKEYPQLQGLTVTMPYKQEIIPFLDKIDPDAECMQSVNALHIVHDKDIQLIGYNTDVYGFEVSLRPLLQPHHNKALILGTGGVASAVRFVLNKLKIENYFVSRKPIEGGFTYSELSTDLLQDFPLIINATPLGMEPLEKECPPIPLQGLSEKHLVYDVIYNPEKTPLLLAAEQQGASIKNGLEMLHRQADRAWKIWTGK